MGTNQFALEPLNSRLYLSISVVNHNLRIEGTDNPNKIIVTQYSDHFSVQLDKQHKNIPRTGIKQLVIYGGDGNDKIDIHACSVRALINGDQGKDTILGGSGSDRLFGGKNDDLIKGGAGNDTIQGGDGEDTLYGNDGDDYFETDDVFWQDFIDGGNGNDSAKIDLGVPGFGKDHVENVGHVTH